MLGGVAFSKSDPSLVVWHRLQPQTEPLLQAIAESVGRSENSTIVMETVEDLALALVKAKASGHLPDLVIGPGDLVGLAQTLDFAPIPKGFQVPSDPRIAFEPRKPRHALAFLGGNHLMVFYSRRYTPSPPENFAQLANWQAKWPDLGFLVWDFHEPYYFYPYLHFFAGPPVDQKGQFAWQKEDIAKALTVYLKPYREGWIRPHCRQTCALQLLKNGEILAMVSGDWAMGAAARSLGEDLLVRPLWSIEKKPLRPLGTGWAIFFPKPPNQQSTPILSKLVKKFQSISTQKKFADLGLVPSHPLVLKTQSQTGQPFQKQALQHWQSALPLRHPNETMALWHIMRKGIAIVTTGRVGISEISERMAKLGSDTLRAQRASQEASEW